LFSFSCSCPVMLCVMYLRWHISREQFSLYLSTFHVELHVS
jgi:hypothetical protein